VYVLFGAALNTNNMGERHAEAFANDFICIIYLGADGSTAFVPDSAAAQYSPREYESWRIDLSQLGTLGQLIGPDRRPQP